MKIEFKVENRNNIYSLNRAIAVSYLDDFHGDSLVYSLRNIEKPESLGLYDINGTAVFAISNDDEGERILLIGEETNLNDTLNELELKLRKFGITLEK